jgi:GAF domain-containing protein
MSPHEDEILTSLSELGDVLLSHQTLDDALSKITELAAELVPGADHVGISLMGGGSIETKSSTDEIARTVDEIQHELGEGPCLESIQQDEIFQIDDIDQEPRWQRFGAAVRAQTPVRSILAVVLDVGHTSIGALNLYAGKVHAFEEDDHAIAAIFAAQAAVTLAATRQR